MIDWKHWHNEPYLVGGLIALAWMHAVLSGPFRQRLAPGSRYPAREALRFHSGLLIFYIAVGSPLDQVGERFLFSAHMFQHQLLIYPAAILFLTGLPGWMIDPVLSLPAVRPLARFLAYPLVAGLSYTLVLSLWHMPILYDWALQDKVVHVAEHVLFFLAAIVYWWPLLSPSKVVPPASFATQMIYIAAVVIGMTPVFAYLTFSTDTLYATYEFAPRIFAQFNAADDQLLAGVMMKIGGLIVALSAFGWSFYRWSREDRHLHVS